MRCLRIQLVSAAAALWLVPAPAFADPQRDPVAAEALFSEARRLMAQGDYAAACPKFADSEALDPAPGTALNLGHCYELAGKQASAWAAYKTAQALAERASQHDRAMIAARKVAELEPALSRLTISVPISSQSPGLEVRLDGELIEAPAWGVAVPRDGGTHDLEAHAQGKMSWQAHIDLAERGQSSVVEIPALRDVVTPTAITHASPAPPVENVRAPTSRPGTGQRAAGLVVLGVGVAGVAFATLAGLHASSTYGDAKDDCNGGTSCSPGNPGIALRNSASSWAALSTVAFATGGTLVAAGAILFFTAPNGRSGAGPMVGLAPSSQGARLLVTGRF